MYYLCCSPADKTAAAALWRPPGIVRHTQGTAGRPRSWGSQSASAIPISHAEESPVLGMHCQNTPRPAESLIPAPKIHCSYPVLPQRRRAHHTRLDRHIEICRPQRGPRVAAQHLVDCDELGVFCALCWSIRITQGYIYVCVCMCVCVSGPHIHRPVRVIHPPPDYLALVDQYAADGRFAGLERCFGLVGVSA
jgi:hypothetical protein